jgi:hypothetical protein
VRDPNATRSDFFHQEINRVPDICVTAASSELSVPSSARIASRYKGFNRVRIIDFAYLLQGAILTRQPQPTAARHLLAISSATLGMSPTAISERWSSSKLDAISRDPRRQRWAQLTRHPETATAAFRASACHYPQRRAAIAKVAISPLTPLICADWSFARLAV